MSRTPQKTIRVTLFFAGLFLINSATTMAATSTQPLIFTSKPSFPITINEGETHTLNYTVQNPGLSGAPSQTLQSTSAIITSGGGGFGTNTGTCATGTTLASQQTCTLSYVYTALSSYQTATGSVSVDYGWRSPLTDDNVQFTVTGSVTPTISVTEPSLMFVNRNSGGSSNYTGTVTVTNTSATTAVTDLTATPSSGITDVTGSPTTCSTTLNASSSCIMAFSTALPVNTAGTVAIGGSNSNSITTPVAAISVVALAPPLATLPFNSGGNFQGLSLVAGCTDTTDDDGLLEITNNSSSSVSSIQASASSALSGVTITNPAYVANTNNYCNGQTLAENDSCEIQISPASVAADTTGTITFSGTGTNNVGIATTVETEASYFPYETSTSSEQGGYIFIAENSCNLVEVVSSTDDSFSPWSSANTYCSGTTSSTGTTYGDWRFPDVGPTPGSTSGTTSSGEFLVLYNGGSPLAGMSTSSEYWGPSINSDIISGYAWYENFNGSSTQNRSTKTSNIYARCARGFTS